jgi:protein-disulfide isomerase
MKAFPLWHTPPSIAEISGFAMLPIALALMPFCAEPARSQTRGADTEAAIEAIVENYLATHPEQIERIVREYLIKHPEVVQASIAQLLMRRAAANPKSGPATANPSDKAAVIKSNSPTLFNSSRQVTLGNPQGDITMVEFFDYNCGYCKRALADMHGLLEADPKLKIVLKELPVLGQPSTEVAHVAVAVRMQDEAGTKYLAFHERLLSSRGRVDKARALEVAVEVGLDVPRLERDMASDEVRATLEENAKLARELGINGTPGYVVGDVVLLGAVGMAALKERIDSQR